MYIVFTLEKSSEKLHLRSLCHTVRCYAVVTSLFSLSLAHALSGTLVLAYEACVGLVAKDILFWGAGVTDTRRDKERSCLWCRGEEDQLLGGL
jgi:hypothetical protein